MGRCPGPFPYGDGSNGEVRLARSAIIRAERATRPGVPETSGPLSAGGATWPRVWLITTYRRNIDPRVAKSLCQESGTASASDQVARATEEQ